MALFRIRLSDRGRLGWLAAAAVLGIAGVAVAVLRRDYLAAVVIALAMATLVATWLWARGDGEPPA